MPAASDSNMLFGMLALQLDFISRDQLVTAMQAWVNDKNKPLADIFRERGDLSSERVGLLGSLVQEHLKMHGNDVQQSLAALRSPAAAQKALAAIDDTDVQASLVPLGQAPAYFETIAPPAGTTGRFRILRQHAKGGLGVVFVAHDNEINRHVALKEIQLQHSGDVDSRSRFVLEAEITGGLEHPGIVPIYGLGRYEDGRPYYAMRFIKGDSLQEAVDAFHKREAAGRDATERGVELRQLLRRFVDVCNAIDYAHSKGVLHRDLKPGNIMLGKFGETLVVDWGLAKIADPSETTASSSAQQDLTEMPLQPSTASASTATQMGSAVGTPAFMPPEQAAGRIDLLSPASDVYSLGATLYAILTSKPPFIGRDLATVLTQVQKGDFPKPRDVNPRVEKPLEAICLKAMATEPSQRYSSAAALKKDVENWIADAPVSAWPEPLSVRARRWLGQHRVLATTSLASLLLAFAFLGILYAVTATANDRLAKSAEAERSAKEAADARRIEAEEAREKAQTAEKVAQSEAAISRAVRDFLQNDLLLLAAAENQGYDAGLKGHIDPNMKVRDLVLRAAKSIEGRFEKQPQVELELRNTIGLTLGQLGYPLEATPHDERAVALSTQLNGVDDFETLVAMSRLATDFSETNRLEEAMKLREKALQLGRSKYPDKIHDILTWMNNSSVSLLECGRKTEALKLREEAYEFARTKLEPNNRHTLALLSQLGSALFAADRKDEAQKVLFQAYEIQQKLLGFHHPDTLRTAGRMAHIAVDRGEYDWAIKMYEPILQSLTKNFGVDHPDTLHVMQDIAYAYGNSNRHTEALKLNEQIVEIRSSRLGINHPQTLIAMHNLAHCCLSLKDYARATKVFEEYLQRAKVTLGVEHSETLQSMLSLAICYWIANRSDDGAKIARECYDIRAAKFGFTNHESIDALNLYAEICLSAGKVDQARTVLQESMQKQAQAPPTLNDKNMGTHAISLALLGEAEERSNSYREARRSYGMAIQIFEASAKTRPLEKSNAATLAKAKAGFEFCEKAEKSLADVGYLLTQSDDDVPSLINVCLRVFLKNKNLDNMLKTAEAANTLAAKDARHAYNASCAWSLASELTTGDPKAKEKRAVEAVRLLRKTPIGPKTSYPDAAALVAHLAKDRDIDALRDREDYKAFVAELEKASKK